MFLSVLDERHIWHGPLCETARARGYYAKRIMKGEHCYPGGIGFIRPHAAPDILKRNIAHDDPFMRQRLLMIQDRAQVEVYDNKTEQTRRWSHLMPATWVCTSLQFALDVCKEWDGILVAKADVGASSNNVTILHDMTAQRKFLEQVFGPGIKVSHSSGGAGDQNHHSIQRGHIILQRYIPNSYTWRVNRIGNHYAIFQRFNHPKRGTAQTGNVQPVKSLSPVAVKLLNYAAEVTREIASKWVALDILIDSRDNPRLIETSLAWPWPSPGDCDNAPFFAYDGCWGTPTYQWRDMWTLMLDEVERGVFA